jgi:phage portal protein BeeE
MTHNPFEPPGSSKALTPKPVPSYTGLTGAHRTYLPDNYSIQSAHAYEKSIYVAQALGRIMDTTGMAKPKVKILKGDKYVEAPKGHPLQRLLDYPGEKMSRYDLMSQTFGRLHLEGNCFWFLNGRGGKPENIQVIPSRFMRIEPDIKEISGVSRYIYCPPGRAEVALLPDSIIHFQRWHPNSEYWGLATLSAGMIEVNADYHMAMWNQNFFGPRNAIPNMAVEFKGQMTDQQFEGARREWTTGGGMQRETIFFRSGAGLKETRIHNIGLTPLEVSFMQGRNLNRKAIYDLFGLHEAMFDKDASEASSITGERLFYQIIYQQLVRIESRLTLELAAFFSRERGDVIIEFQDIRPVNEELKLKQIEAAAKFLSIDEIRADYYDKEPAAGGWGDGPALGGGSARLMFLQNPQQAQENQQQMQAGFDRGRQENNHPAPGQEREKQPETGRQARGEYRKPAEHLQRKALKEFRAGTLDPAVLDLTDFPAEMQKTIRSGLSFVTTEKDILRVFDPYFEQSHTPIIELEKQSQHWTDRQVAKLPKVARESVKQAVPGYLAALSFDERIEALLDVPDELWNNPTPEIAAQL